ncbi:hypothetical protein ES703_83958 [subsurface metagenome]
MGTPVPEEWPELDDDKWYAIDVTNYALFPDPKGCTNPVVGKDHCCRRGDWLNIWYANEVDCLVASTAPCGITPGDSRLITCIVGPFDSQEECEAA